MGEEKHTILSIDDSKAVHAFLDRCLFESGADFTFVHAMGVTEGLKVLEGTLKISAILLDWEMPEITGYDGIPMIINKAPHIPIIILTSKNDPEDISQMLNRGAKEYMMKPFTPDILIEKLKTVLAGKSDAT